MQENIDGQKNCEFQIEKCQGSVNRSPSNPDLVPSAIQGEGHVSHSLEGMDDSMNDGQGRITEMWAKWAVPKYNQTHINFDENNFGRNLLSMMIKRENGNWNTSTDHKVFQSYDFIAYDQSNIKIDKNEIIIEMRIFMNPKDVQQGKGIAGLQFVVVAENGTNKILTLGNISKSRLTQVTRRPHDDFEFGYFKYYRLLYYHLH